MAVDLAKLGLWLHAFVPGLPLSYLGHTLRHGNALVGLVGNEVAQRFSGTLFEMTLQTALTKALPAARDLAAIDDLALIDVKVSETKQCEMNNTLKSMAAAFDAFTCRIFAGAACAALEHSDGVHTIVRNSVDRAYAAGIATATGVARGLLAFH